MRLVSELHVHKTRLIRDPANISFKQDLPAPRAPRYCFLAPLHSQQGDRYFVVHYGILFGLCTGQNNGEKKGPGPTTSKVGDSL